MATTKHTSQAGDRSWIPAQTSSPFYARSYGGFTKAQEEFYLSHIGRPLEKIILDPMGGTGYALSELARRGGNIWLGDINPALLLLAMLRDLQVIRRSVELAAWFTRWLEPLKPKRNYKVQLEYIDDWIAPSIREDLSFYFDRLGIGRLSSPFLYEGGFWSAPIESRFAACLPVLAARGLTCFRSSDNKTWLKKGGLSRETRIYNPIMRALDQWCRFAEQIYTEDKLCAGWGSVNVQRMNVELGLFGSCPYADTIITSPPYANRLDYTRMWAPELEITSEMWGGDSFQIKSEQIGSTVVKGKKDLLEEAATLPSIIVDSLEAIRTDSSWKASNSYYYPFFRNYAIALNRSLKQMASHLKPEGTLVIFVRDTVRKDVMFPTVELVKATLSQRGLHEINRDRKIYREHVGLLRKASARGLYGLAQQEWWLVFRKDS